MKLTIRNITDSISSMIEAYARESDSVASGVIGSSFSTSGPGSGWSQQFDVRDYAKRALSEDYGASSYIDSDDGREATLDSDGNLEWSDESVVEIELPSVEEALEDMSTWEIIKKGAANYGVDQSEIDDLAEKIDNPYVISDGNATEYASTLEDAESIIEDWYDYLAEDQGCPGGFGRQDEEEDEDEWEMPSPNLDSSSLESLQASIGKWEQEIAHSKGGKDFAGHGNYYVTAADRMGLNLTVNIRA